MARTSKIARDRVCLWLPLFAEGLPESLPQATQIERRTGYFWSFIASLCSFCPLVPATARVVQRGGEPQPNTAEDAEDTGPLSPLRRWDALAGFQGWQRCREGQRVVALRGDLAPFGIEQSQCVVVHSQKVLRLCGSVGGQLVGSWRPGPKASIRTTIHATICRGSRDWSR